MTSIKIICLLLDASQLQHTKSLREYWIIPNISAPIIAWARFNLELANLLPSQVAKTGWSRQGVDEE